MKTVCSIPVAILLLISVTCIIPALSLLTCHPTSIENYFQKRSNASNEVSHLIRDNFLIEGNDTSNVTTNITMLYTQLIAVNNISKSEKGLDNFKNAFNEVTDSYFTSCERSSTDKDAITTKNTIMSSFVNQLAGDKSTADYSNIRRDYGKLLCYQKSTENSLNDENIYQKRKRSSSLVECASSPTVQALHDCLDPFNVWPCVFNIDPLSKDCPSQTTSNNEQQEALNCLAFVVDTTGSMSEEIEAARQIIKQFIQSEENILTLCYVLVAFNDYWYNDPVNNLEFYKIYDAHYISTNSGGPHFNVSNGTVPVYGTDTLLTDVNGLVAHGGFDCPEFGMIGILKAIELINGINNPKVKSFGKHNVIVLTDASAYDNSLYSYVISNATSEGSADITVHFFFSDDYGCSCYGYGNYPDIANATCGFAVHSINAQAFTQFADYLYTAQQRQQSSVNSCAARHEAAGTNENTNCKSYNVTVFVTKFSILIQGSANSPIMTVTQPNGVIETITIDGDFTIYERDDPQYGQWTICLSSGHIVEFSVSVNEERLQFKLHPVDYDSMEFYPTSGELFTCEMVYFIIKTNKLEKIDFNQSLLLLQLIDATDNTTVITQTQLTSCANSIIGSLRIPAISSLTLPLYYQITGQSIDGIQFVEKISNIDSFSFSKSKTITLSSSVNESIIFMPQNGLTKFQYTIESESKNDNTLISISWSLSSNNTMIHSTSPTTHNISKNILHHFDISLDINSIIDLNHIALQNQDFNWTLTVINQCDDHSYTLSIPAVLVPPLTISATNSCSADVTLKWNNSLTISAGAISNVSLEFNNKSTLYFNSMPETNLVLSNLPYKESVDVNVMTSIYHSGQYISLHVTDRIWTNGQVPSSPRNVAVSQKDKSSFDVQLKWLPPLCWNSKKIHYIVYYKSEQELGWNIQSVITASDDINTIVQTSVINLQPGNNTFKVAGVNPVGTGIESDQVTIQINPPRKPTEAPPKDDNTNDQSAGILVVTTVSIPICFGILLALSCMALVLVIMFRRKKLERRQEKYEQDDAWTDYDASSQYSMNTLQTNKLAFQ